MTAAAERQSVKLAEIEVALTDRRWQLAELLEERAEAMLS